MHAAVIPPIADPDNPLLPTRLSETIRESEPDAVGAAEEASAGDECSALEDTLLAVAETELALL